MTLNDYNLATSLVDAINLNTAQKAFIEANKDGGVHSIRWRIEFSNGEIADVANPDAAETQEILLDIIARLDADVDAKTTDLEAI